MRLAPVLLLALFLGCARGQLWCSQLRGPGAPVGLIATGGNGNVTVAWDRPAGSACVASYKIDIQRSDRVGKLNSFTTTGTEFVVTNVANDVSYNINVTAQGPRFVGATASTRAVPTPYRRAADVATPAVAPAAANNGWTCAGGVKDAPVCRAAKSGLCTPMTCAELAAAGLCNSIFMRQMDWDARVVTQACTQECGCSATPTLRRGLSDAANDVCCATKVADYFSRS